MATIALNAYLFMIVPKGFFPDQDTGRLQGSIVADQDTSFTAMNQRLQQMIKIVLGDKDVEWLAGFTGGGGGLNTARMFVTLKPLSQRKTADQIIAELRPKLARIPGATLYLQSCAGPAHRRPVQGNAEYQYSLVSDDFKRRRDLGAKAAGRELKKDSRAHRRQQRPAEPGPAIAIDL